MDLKPGYWRYDELTGILEQLAASYPRLVRLGSIGRSRQGREIWYLTVTDHEAGRPEDKPALYIDGNFHGSEPTGCAVAVYTAWLCARNFNDDARIARLLRERTLYIVPRVNPDGAEDYLSLPERHFGGVLTHTMRPYPVDEEGAVLFPEDVDGDGLILQMRVPDPLGEWRVSSRDPRVMLRRRPGDEGPFYRLYPEGMIRNYDGTLFDVRLGNYRLNLNRNFPAHFVPEWEQPMSGPYPLSEPESRAVAEFVIDHPNIVIAQSYHTHSGVILRPLATEDDGRMEPEDLNWYRELGRIGEEITGYPCVSTYTGFTPEPRHKAPRRGTFLDWAYEHYGILAFSTELWDPDHQAGNARSLFLELTEEEELRALRWNDEELGGEGFVAWRAFDHPQLGPVEIGGWKKEWTGRNPPLSLLAEECRKNAEHALSLAESTPRLEVRRVDVVDRGGDIYEIVAVVANAGYLPTYGTVIGRRSGLAGQVTGRLEPGAGVEVLTEPAVQRVGHLMGYGSQKAGFFYAPPPRREAVLRWLVRRRPQGEAGAWLRLSVSAPRAGRVEQRIDLPAGEGEDR